MKKKSNRGRPKLSPAKKGSKRTFHGAPSQWDRWESLLKATGLRPTECFWHCVEEGIRVPFFEMAD